MGGYLSGISGFGACNVKDMCGKYWFYVLSCLVQLFLWMVIIGHRGKHFNNSCRVTSLPNFPYAWWCFEMIPMTEPLTELRVAYALHSILCFLKWLWWAEKRRLNTFIHVVVHGLYQEKLYVQHFSDICLQSHPSCFAVLEHAEAFGLHRQGRWKISLCYTL